MNMYKLVQVRTAYADQMRRQVGRKEQTDNLRKQIEALEAELSKLVCEGDDEQHDAAEFYSRVLHEEHPPLVEPKAGDLLTYASPYHNYGYFKIGQTYQIEAGGTASEKEYVWLSFDAWKIFSKDELSRLAKRNRHPSVEAFVHAFNESKFDFKREYWVMGVTPHAEIIFEGEMK